MMKAAAFVCVITLGTFLIITADTGGDIESNNDHLSASKTGRPAVRNTERNKTADVRAPDYDDDSEGLSASAPVSERGRNNDKNKAGRNAPPSGGDSDGLTTRKPKERENRRKQGNEGNLTEIKEASTSGGVITTRAPTIQNACSSPPEIEGAMSPRVEGTEHKVGTTVTYSCNFGYVSRNSINHISRCIFNEVVGKAEWTVPEVSCIPRSCGDPGYVSNGRRIGNLFTFPNKVEYECEEGYKIRGLRARYCQAGGDWSGKLPICEQIYCTVPSDPVNGRVRYSSLEYGTELRYECNAGFVLMKHQPRFCAEDGSWSDDEPECAEVRCEEPQAPEHGTVRLSGDPKIGSLATYSCDRNKKLYGAATTKCLSTGQWTFDPPKCISFCNVPDVKNGEMGHIQNRTISRWRVIPEFKKFSTGSQVDHNETLLLRCNGDFLPTDDSTIFEDNQLEVTCTDGAWSKNFWCKETSCFEDPPPVQNGKPYIPDRKHGQTIWYNCNNKTYTKVTGRIICHFGTWKGYTPKCLDSPCNTKELNFPGLVKPTDEYLPSMESFDIVCENGFTKSSSVEKVTCNRKIWDVTENPCTKTASCKTHEINYPGLEKPSREIFGSFESFDIICKNGFRKVTPNRVITCVNGKWNTVEDPCSKETTCPVFSYENGLNVSYTNENKPRSWATFSCPSHMKLTGASTSFCQDNGIWSLPQPYCQDRNYDATTSIIRPATDSVSKEDKESPESSGHPTQECTCTYGYSSYFVIARVGRKVLEEGDTVRKGVTVSFECKAENRVLTWENGLSLYEEKVNMTCSRCQKWEKRDLPDCKFYQDGHPLILYDNKLKILPGGVAEIKKGETVRLHCSSTLDYPIWYSNGKIVQYQTRDIENKVFYVYIDLIETNDQNIGKYDCLVRHSSLSGSNTLDLLVTASEHDRTTSIIPPHTDLISNQHKVRPGSSNQTTEKCTCTYDISRYHVTARVGDKVLQKGDTVRRGETVSFECKAGNMVLSWNNGLRLYGKVNMTCNRCQKWEKRDLPDCKVHQEGHPLIYYDKLKILPGGAAEIKKGETFRFHCSSTFVYPRWYFNGNPVENQGYYTDNRTYFATVASTGTDELHGGNLNCSVESRYATRRGSSALNLVVTDYISCSRFPSSPGLVVSYSEGVSVGSNASFTCSPPNSLVGSSYAICQNTGSWNHPLPKCEEITCPRFSTGNGLSVRYDNFNGRGSLATFNCSASTKLVGDTHSRCQNDGTWSKPKPHCEEISCPIFSTDNGLSVRYDNFNRRGSLATFGCYFANTILVGDTHSRCQNDGTWSKPKPHCEEITCPIFSIGNGLSVRYNNFNRRGSLATFSCSASAKLVGDTHSICQNDGTWTKPKPHCEEPSCSVADLAATVPEGVIPNMTDVTGEFITLGSEMRLECENNLIPNGNSKATCRNNGSWEFGSFQCVPGCNLKTDPSSHLIIQPVKDSYRLGEFILLSCPLGEKMTNDVERLMCLGKTWSDIIPDCEESKQSSPSES